MKVMQVLPALESGGVERGTLEIARALVHAGHESWVLSAGGKLTAQLEAEGSGHVCWDLGRKSLLTFLQVRKLRRWLVEQRFDIIHVRSRMPAWVVWLAWRGMAPRSRPRLVSTVHGFYSVNRYSEIMTCGERVIAVSEAIRSYIAQNYPRVDQSRLRLIYRGIDPNEFPANFVASEHWQQTWYAAFPELKDQLVVTLPGRLTRLKGHGEFLKAIAALRAQGLAVKALIVGGEDPKRLSYAREIYQQVVTLGLQDAVVFCGARADMKEIYSVSNVVVSLSSKPESFGRTVLEALSMGVPVVAYAHGGVKEILEALFPEGQVALNDFEGLVSKLSRVLLHKPPVRPNTHFLLSTMQDETLALYEELLRS